MCSIALFSEKVCTYDGVGSNYGISEEGGVKRLKGPGVYEAPGAAQMGGRLPFRLAEMCETYRYYSVFANIPKLRLLPAFWLGNLTELWNLG